MYTDESMNKKIIVHPLLKEIAGIFNSHNKKVYLAGGAVRDLLRKKEASDWDLATDAQSGEVCGMFRRVIKTGIKHGTVTILYKDYSLEVTTFRTEAAYSDGRHPDAVQFAASIEEDLSRRDFTMNAIAAELPSGVIVDPFNGAQDIDNKIIRCVGSAAERFNEDGLRPVRALRFASTLGFSLDGEIIKAIPAALSITAKVSPERIRDELIKIILSQRPGAALTIMMETGLLQLLIPELAACAGVEQKGRHRFDVWTHSVLACDYAAEINSSKAVRFAALLHDIGKPAAARLDERGIWTFYNHEKISANLARDILFRLRFPNAFIDDVIHLIDEHMFHYEDVWNDAAVRRFVARAGEENLPELFDLRRADSFGMRGVAPPCDLLLSFQLRIERVLTKSRAISIKNLAVNGTDLMAAGLPAGPRLGIILKRLLDAVLEDPALNTKDHLLKIALELSS
jgi:putative nucleotidyltransferase with HDIG domain